MALAMVSERHGWEQGDEMRRFHHSAKSEGLVRRSRRTAKERAADRALIETKGTRSTMGDVQKALQARERATQAVAAQLSAMPDGQEKYAAVVACLDQFSQSELAVLLKVSRQRISQMKAAHDVIPF